jgi:hypothetical protein
VYAAGVRAHQAFVSRYQRSLGVARIAAILHASAEENDLAMLQAASSARQSRD